MGCGSCGTGKPGGCKSNGGCSTGGCNRLNVHDWLSDLPIDDINSQCKVVEVSFNQGSRKDFFKNLSSQIFDHLLKDHKLWVDHPLLFHCELHLININNRQ